MKTERDLWVRVRDESELREGMAVQLRPCSWCKRVETFFLGRRDRRPCIDMSGTISDPEDGFMTTGRCEQAFGTGIAPGDAVRTGRLFRLSDDALSTDAATTERARERVTAK